MKTFSYTARDQSGLTTKGVVQAVDRTSALHTIKKQGLIPLSIIDQTNQSISQRLTWKIIGFIAGGLFLVIIAAVMLTQRSQFQQKAEKGKDSSAYNDTAAQHTHDQAKTNLEIQVSEHVVSSKSQKKNTLRVNVEKPRTNELSMIAEIEKTNTIPPRMFNSGVEQIINMIANTKPGSPVPPLLRLHIKENVEEILNKDIVLYDEDNALTAEKKANVAHAKQLMKAYLAQGGKPEDFLAYYHTELKKAHTDWREAQIHAITLLKGDDLKVAFRYIEEINRTFAEKGIKPINVPQQP